MQTDGKNIYIGDEKGKFYAFYLNKTASLINGDISDPNNTFIKNPKVFKWTFNDETFDFQKNDITFLENGILYTEMKNGLASQSCLFALNTDNGKPKWTKILKGDVLNWGLKNNKITGYTENTIFHIGINGKDFKEIPIKSIPLSNIEWLDKAHMIYITKKGIEVFDTETQTSKIIFEKSFNDKNVHNNVQIKYIVK